jgi:hypothetical protein
MVPQAHVVASAGMSSIIPRKKVGSGGPVIGENKTNGPLDRVRVDSSKRALTTNQGVPVADNQNSLKAGVGARLGEVTMTGGAHQVDATVETMPSVLWDAVVLPDGDDALEQLGVDGRVLEFIKDGRRRSRRHRRVHPGHCQALTFERETDPPRV